MVDISEQWIAQLIRLAPFADNEAGIPEMCAALRDLRDALTKAERQLEMRAKNWRAFYDAPPREISVAEAAQVLLDKMDRRQWEWLRKDYRQRETRSFKSAMTIALRSMILRALAEGGSQ